MPRLIAPETLPMGFTCRQVLIPDDPFIIAAVNGALSYLVDPYRWEQLTPGGPTAQDIADLCRTMYLDYLDSECSGAEPMTEVFVKYNKSSGQTFNNGVATIVDFNDLVEETHQAVTTGAAWKFTVPADLGGLYLIIHRLYFSATSTFRDGENLFVQMAVNNVLDELLGFANNIAANTSVQFTASTLKRLAAGDFIDLRMTQTSGGNVTAGFLPLYNGISIRRVAP